MNGETEMNQYFKERYAEYQVGESTVRIGRRMDMDVSPENQAIWMSQYDAIMSVTSRFISIYHECPISPPVATAWFPWDEGGPPTPEFIYGTLRVLDLWISKQKRKKIYLHCDAGTHRAPSTFGFYLKAFHGENNQNLVIDEKYTAIVGCEPKYRSSPVRYAQTYFDRNSWILPYIEHIAKQQPSVWGWEDCEQALASTKHWMEKNGIQYTSENKHN